jgi:Glycosyltransferase family 87
MQKQTAPLRPSPHPAKPTPARLGAAPFWTAVLFLSTAALGSWFLIGPALHGSRYYTVGYNRTTFEYNLQLVLLLIPYGLALWAWRRGSRVPLWALLAGAAVLHILVLFAPLPQSQDLYQYLFYGKMQVAHHANPYLVHPNVFWADRWLAWVRWRDQPSVYGPVWMLVVRGVAQAAGSSLSVAFVLLKVLILAVDAAVAALVVMIARRGPDPGGRAGWAVLAFAWNPLVFVNVPLGGAVDIVIAACFLGAYLAHRRRWTALAVVLLTVASLVKVYAAVALLLYLVLVARERGWLAAIRNTALAVAVTAAAYAPYWSGPRTFAGVAEATSLTNVSLTGTIQRLLVPVVRGLGLREPRATSRVVHALAGVLLAAVVVWAIRRVWSKRDVWQVIVATLFAYLVLTPWFLPWYTIAPLALIVVLRRSRLTVPFLVFVGTSLAVLWTPARTVDWVWVSVIHYVPPASAYVWERVRERRASREAGTIAEPQVVHAPSALPTAGAIAWEPAAK